jgi:hypothetical protein
MENGESVSMAADNGGVIESERNNNEDNGELAARRININVKMACFALARMSESVENEAISGGRRENGGVENAERKWHRRNGSGNIMKYRTGEASHRRNEGRMK